jgi:hypothetical protein
MSLDPEAHKHSPYGERLNPLARRPDCACGKRAWWALTAGGHACSRCLSALERAGLASGELVEDSSGWLRPAVLTAP